MVSSRLAPLVIDLTGPEPANSNIPISQPKDTSNDVVDAPQGYI
jgi:hypothetical protein